MPDIESSKDEVIESSISEQQNKKYDQVSSITKENLKSDLEGFDYRIKFSQEKVLEYLDITREIFKSFSLGETTFNEVIEEQKNMGKINEDLEHFKKCLQILLLAWNFCTEFDEIDWKDDKEEVCNISRPYVNKNLKGKVVCSLSRSNDGKYMTIQIEKDIISEGEKSEDIISEGKKSESEKSEGEKLINYEIFRRIRNRIAHGFSIIIQGGCGYVCINNEKFNVKIAEGFFLSGMCLNYNRTTKDWYYINPNVLEDKYLEDTKNISYTRYKYKKQENTQEKQENTQEKQENTQEKQENTQEKQARPTYGEIIHGKLEEFEKFLNESGFYEKSNCDLDEFQKYILVQILKDPNKYYNNERSKLMEYIYYSPVNDLKIWIILNNLVAELFNDGNRNLSGIKDSLYKKYEEMYKRTGVTPDDYNLIMNNLDNIFTRNYLKYYFTSKKRVVDEKELKSLDKEERKRVEEEYKICHHLRNCFIHGYHTRLPVNEIGFQDHPKTNEKKITFSGHCKMDELVKKISNGELIKDIFNNLYIYGT